MTVACPPLDERLVIVADHASSSIPDDLGLLGLDPALLDDHIAVDIGTARLGELLAADLRVPLHLGTVSRLVIDLHREPAHLGLIPQASDGIEIPGNRDLSPAARAARTRRFYTPYHAAITARLDAMQAAGIAPVLLALHSFTPKLRTRPDEQRPWQTGILYNRDAALAYAAIDWLRKQDGLSVGDNQPYSGTLLNNSMNMHGEARAIPYLTLEIRQDLLADEAGIAHWARLVANMMHEIMPPPGAPLR